MAACLLSLQNGLPPSLLVHGMEKCFCTACQKDNKERKSSTTIMCLLLHSLCLVFFPLAAPLQRYSALIFPHECTRFIAPVNSAKEKGGKHRYSKTLGNASRKSPDLLSTRIATNTSLSLPLLCQDKSGAGDEHRGIMHKSLKESREEAL